MKLLMLLSLIYPIKGFLNNIDLVNLKINTVIESSKILPKIDTIGHNLLLNNEIIIKKILIMNDIPMEIKKSIVLDIIRVTQYGDQFGGFILSHYHDLVDLLL